MLFNIGALSYLKFMPTDLERRLLPAKKFKQLAEQI